MQQARVLGTFEQYCANYKRKLSADKTKQNQLDTNLMANICMMMGFWSPEVIAHSSLLRLSARKLRNIVYLTFFLRYKLWGINCFVFDNIGRRDCPDNHILPQDPNLIHLFHSLESTRLCTCSDLGNSKIIDIEDNVINSVGTGTKPERIVFVLLENQSCEPTTISPRLPEDQQQQQQRPQQFEQRHQAYTTPQTPAAAMTTAASMITHQSTQSFIQPQLLLEDVCSLAPKVSGDSPCFNGGLCKTSDLSASNFTCLCAPGFTGPLCETNIDDCVDHQCQNGAICVDGVQSYKCICRDPTTSGEFCEQLNSYTTSSANSIAPMALPIIASSAPQQQTITTTSYGGELTPQVQSAPKQQMIRTNINNINSNIQNAIGSQQQQILTRSADFAPSAKSSATVSAIAVADPDASCKRITRRTYFDDGNGCQSARMLKMSECSGYCTGNSNGSDSGEGCCIATKVKRRRIRMQCNDGASYVKTIDLVKKCSCSNDCSNIELTQPPFLNQPPQQRQQQHGSPSPFPNYYNASQDDQLLQITRLDAVDWKGGWQRNFMQANGFHTTLTSPVREQYPHTHVYYLNRFVVQFICIDSFRAK